MVTVINAETRSLMHKCSGENPSHKSPQASRPVLVVGEVGLIRCQPVSLGAVAEQFFDFEQWCKTMLQAIKSR